MYFRLANYCALVEGFTRGAIYNLQTGKVHSLNKRAVEILEKCRQNHLQEDFFSHKEELDFLERLCQLGLGSFYINDPGILEYRPPKVEAKKLEFLWLELTSGCNNKCLHCYTASEPTAKPKVPQQRWLNLIQEAADTGASSLQLIGGEPLLYPYWRELVLQAERVGFANIEIFTNATLIDKDCIEFFQKHNVQIATTLYADNAKIHDAVTQNPGSFIKTMTAIRNLLNAQIPLRIASIMMKTNEGEAENILNLLEDLGVEASPPDVIRPTGRGENKHLLPDNYHKQPIQPPFFTDEDSFNQMHNCHNCLSGILAVTSEGKVIPCIFARNHICGDILSTSLAEIIQGEKLQKCWHTTKDKVSKCQDCEYRYACFDCRPLAQSMDEKKNWLAPSPECSYNPYSGKWED